MHTRMPLFRSPGWGDSSDTTNEGVPMATRDITTDDRRIEASRPTVTRREETKVSFLTTEFWAMVGVIAAVLVAAQQADNFDAPRAWTLVAAVAIGYMVSRGLAKSGGSHRDRDDNREHRARRGPRGGLPPRTFLTQIIGGWLLAAPTEARTRLTVSAASRRTFGSTWSPEAARRADGPADRAREQSSSRWPLSRFLPYAAARTRACFTCSSGVASRS
jgi:hypothetical protein